MQIKKRGIVAQIENGFCIIINKDGTFARIPVPEAGTRIGEEITYSNLVSIVKPVILVASLLLVFLGYALIQQTTVPKAIAYVSVDINPSLEIAVDKNLNAVSVNCFNHEAVKLLKHDNITGKNIYTVLNLISRKAIEQHYIKANQKNLIVSTVAVSDNDIYMINNKKIQQSLESSVINDGMNVQVKIYSVSLELRTKAEKMGLSPAKFIVYEQLKASGKQVTINDVKKSEIMNLSNKYNIELPPNNQKININPDNRHRLLIEDEVHYSPISILENNTKIDKNEMISNPAPGRKNIERFFMPVLPKKDPISNPDASSSPNDSEKKIEPILPESNTISNPDTAPSQNNNEKTIDPVLPESNTISNPAAAPSRNNNEKTIEPVLPESNTISNPTASPSRDSNEKTIEPVLPESDTINNPAAAPNRNNDEKTIEPVSPESNTISNPGAAFQPAQQ